MNTFIFRTKYDLYVIYGPKNRKLSQKFPNNLEMKNKKPSKTQRKKETQENQENSNRTLIENKLKTNRKLRKPILENPPRKGWNKTPEK